MGARAQRPTPQDYIVGAVLLVEVAAFLEQQPLPSALAEAQPLLASLEAEAVVALAPPHLACSVEQDFFFFPKRPPASTGLVRASKAAALSKRATFFIVIRVYGLNWIVILR